MNDNTSEDLTPQEEVETPEEEIVEGEETEIEEDTQVEEEPVITFNGRQYASLEDAEKQFKEMQKRATQAEQKLKAHESQVKAEQEMSKFKDMDPEEKLEWLAQRQLEKETLQAEVEEAKEEEQTFVADTAEVKAYIKTQPYLSKYPTLADKFMKLAVLPEYKDYTLESIFDVEFKPLIDDLAGKKVKVTRKVAPGKKTVQQGFTNEQIAAMSPAEYEKNREKILAQMNNK